MVLVNADDFLKKPREFPPTYLLFGTLNVTFAKVTLQGALFQTHGCY